MDIQVEEWLNHPITEQLFFSINKERKELIELLVSGYSSMKTCEATGIEYIKLVSRIGGLDVIETFKERLKKGE